MAKIKTTTTKINDFVEKMKRHQGTPFPGFTCANPPTDKERAAMRERLEYEKEVEKDS